MGERIYFFFPPFCNLRKSALLVYVVLLSKPGMRWGRPRALGGSHTKVRASKVKSVSWVLVLPITWFFSFLKIFCYYYYFGLKPVLVYKFNGGFEVDQGDLWAIPFNFSDETSFWAAAVWIWMTFLLSGCRQGLQRIHGAWARGGPLFCGGTLQGGLMPWAGDVAFSPLFPFVWNQPSTNAVQNASVLVEHSCSPLVLQISSPPTPLTPATPEL